MNLKAFRGVGLPDTVGNYGYQTMNIRWQLCGEWPSRQSYKGNARASSVIVSNARSASSDVVYVWPT